MKERLRALLIQARHNPSSSVRLALEEQSVDIYMARTCAEAALSIIGDSPPALVFTEAQLADGDWTDIMMLATKASAPVSVVVVAPAEDLGLYVQAIEHGASDFIVPTLSDPELFHVVRNAADHALRQRSQPALTDRPNLVPGAGGVSKGASVKD